MAVFDVSGRYFDEQVRKLEPTDLVHANIFNQIFWQIINNEVYLHQDMEAIHNNIRSVIREYLDENLIGGLDSSDVLKDYVPAANGDGTWSWRKLVNVDSALSEESENPVQNKIINDAINSIKREISQIRYKKVNAIVEAANWEGSEAPYTNTITISGATETNDIQVMPADTITVDQAGSWSGAMIMAATQASGSITLKAFGDKPEIDIPVTVLVGSDVSSQDNEQEVIDQEVMFLTLDNDVYSGTVLSIDNNDYNVQDISESQNTKYNYEIL